MNDRLHTQCQSRQQGRSRWTRVAEHQTRLLLLQESEGLSLTSGDELLRCIARVSALLIEVSYPGIIRLRGGAVER